MTGTQESRDDVSKGPAIVSVTRLELVCFLRIPHADMCDLNYFVCTLGQAVKTNQNNPHQFTTINEFIDHQAHVIPGGLAIGFPVPTDSGYDGQWESIIFSKELSLYKLGELIIFVSF